MSNLTNPLAAISYTDKDFESIYPELLDLVKKLTYRWDPSISNESDPGVILLKLNALIADKNNYNIDSNIMECFPETVSQLTNARQLFGQLGYFMKWYQSATSVLSLKYIGPKVESPFFTIPRFTMVTDSEREIIYSIIGVTVNGKPDLNVTDIILDTQNGETATATIMQGVAVQYSINGDTTINVSHLDSNRRLYFDTNMVAQNGVFITNVDNTNYAEWVQKDNLLVEEPGQTIYSFGVTNDGNYCYLEFPEDVENIFKSGITITYIKTGGAQGNIASGVLSDFYYSFTPVEDVRVNITRENVKVLNIYSAVDGKDPESIDSGYRNYKRVVGTFDTLVTLRDYLNYVLRSELVSNGFVCDRTNDLQDTYDILTMSDSIVSSVHIVEDDAIPGYKSGNNFYRGYVPLSMPIFYDPYTASDIGKNKCLDILTGNLYELNSSNRLEKLDSLEKFDAFSLKLYLLQYLPSVTADESYKATFAMLDNSKQDTVKDYLQDVKSLQHDFKDLEPIDSFSANVCYFKNKYPIDCRITTQYALTTAEAAEMLVTIKQAIYDNLSAKAIDFGQKITIDDVYETIINSDKRIKNVSVGNINFTTYAVLYNPKKVENSVYPFDEIEINSDNSDDWVELSYNFANTDLIAAVDPQIFIDVVGGENYSDITLEYNSPIWRIKGNSSYSFNNPSDFGIYRQAQSKLRVTTNTNRVTTLDPIYNIVSVYRNGTAMLASSYYINENSVVFPNTLRPGDDVVITYWTSNWSNLTTKDSITARVSKKMQIRDEIYTKSVLAGKTPLLVDDSKYQHRFDQLYKADGITANDQIDGIKYIKTNSVISMDNTNNTYVLRDNESLQLYSPNLIEEATYTNYVKFEFYLSSGQSKTISPNTNYQLLDGEYLFLYWKDSEENTAGYRYAAYGQGNVVCPNFSLTTSQTCYGYSRLHDEVDRNPEHKSFTSDTGLDEELTRIITNNLTASYNILSNTKTIVIKRVNTVTLTSTDGCYCYWILNEDDGGVDGDPQYVLEVNHGTDTSHDRILDSGEYFIYSNNNLSELSILGFGTKIHIVDNSNASVDVWKVRKLDTSLILNSGASALANYWKQIVQDSEVIVTENQFVTLNTGCAVTITGLDADTTSWSRVFEREGATSGITNRKYHSFQTVMWEGDIASSRIITINVTPTQGCLEIENVKAGDPFINNYEVHRVGNYIDYITIDAGAIDIGTSVTVYYTYEIIGGDTQDLSLSGFEIKYTTPDTGEEVILPGMELKDKNNNPISWEAQSLLSLIVSPTQEQILYSNQSIEFINYADTSVGTLVGQDLNESDGIYPTVILSSHPISTDGSSNRLPIYTQDLEYNRTYVDFLAYQKKQSDDYTIYNESAVNFVFLEGESIKEIDFIAPAGDYILLIDNTNKLPDGDVLTVYVDGEKLHCINNTTDEVIDTRAYYFNLSITNDISRNRKLKVTRVNTDEQMTVVVKYPFKYTNTSDITPAYFSRILKLIQKFDKDDIFDYTYQVKDDDLIIDPCSSEAFMNPHHIYNKFTICEADLKNTSIYIAGKR